MAASTPYNLFVGWRDAASLKIVGFGNVSFLGCLLLAVGLACSNPSLNRNVRQAALVS